MVKTRTKLYIGCSLTHAPEVFREEVEGLKEDLRAEHEVLDFVGLVAGTAKDVYNWDIKHCTTVCDLFVGIHAFPADGLGYELSYRVEALRKPALSVYPEGHRISRLIPGIFGEENPNFSIATYEDLRRDVPGIIGQTILKMGINL